MTLFNCNCKSDCTGLAIAVSLVVGIITAFLRITAVITVTPVFLLVVLGIAVVYLLVLSAASVTGERTGCCRVINTLLVALLGTIILSVVLLSITFAATSVIGAIITGLLLTFVTLIFTATACYIKCIVDCNN